MDRRHRLEIVAAGASLAAAGLVMPGEGNLSVRVNEQQCLITQRGVDKGRLSTRQIVLVSITDPGDRPAEVSIEAGIHCGLMRSDPKIAAVVHAHPPYVQRLAVSNTLPDCSLLVEGALLLPGVGWVSSIAPGSSALAAAVVEAMRSWPACVLDGHGAVAVGASLAEAMRRMFLLERLAMLTSAPRAR